MNTLIVDDEPLARNELHYLLDEISGFDLIDEAENIEETLEKLLYETYDLVFIDINLMDENGVDLAHKIQKMKHAPYIIFATAHDTFAVKAFELNAIDYILKPFELDRVDQAVQKVKKFSDFPSDTSEEATSNQQVSFSEMSQTSNNEESVIPIEVNERIYIININAVSYTHL